MAHNQNRGRSLSASRQTNIRHSPSPHAQPVTTSSGFDPTLSRPPHQDNLVTLPQHAHQPQFDPFQYPLTDFPQGQRQRLDPHTQSLPNQQLAFNSQYPSHLQATGQPFDPFGSTDFKDIDALDPSLQYPDSNQSFPNLENTQYDPFLEFDSSLADPGRFQDPSQSAYNMSTASQRAPHPPHLLQQNMQQQSSYGGPDFQDSYQNTQQSPHTSLDPSSAAFPQDNSFQIHRGHHRSPSDQRSDVSSNGNTPYLDANESFDYHSGGPSPMLNGAGDVAVFGPEALGFDHFSLNDPSNHHISPGHSSHPSPYVGPQQQGPNMFNGQDGLGFDLDPSQFPDLQGQEELSPSEAFPTMPHLQHFDSQGRGEADTMSPPVITFEPAPPSKQNSFMDMAEAQRQANLSPPSQCKLDFMLQYVLSDAKDDTAMNRTGGRQRANTAPENAPSPRDPSPARARSPSLGLRPTDTLQPPRSRSGSRGSQDGVNKNHLRRESSPSRPERSTEQQDRMYQMAMDAKQSSPQPSDPGSDLGGSPGSNSGFEGSPGDRSTSSNNAGRKQKHPATFECHLCTKRFTRAYNLRSHLRTHTDERPFVCTVCGKAFARQHDRKRHEGLHSGEKKFVCRGDLQDATGQKMGTWGCGRRFARADALGRHFRSEAGRACIKPLLDEEARHRRQDLNEQQNAQMMHQAQAAHMQQSQMQMNMPMGQNIEVSGMPLPAALLAQYPALAGIDLNAPLPSDYDPSDYDEMGGASDYDIDISARSSFDAPRSSYEADAGYQEQYNNGYQGQQMPMDPNFAMQQGMSQQQGMGQQQWGYQQ